MLAENRRCEPTPPLLGAPVRVTPLECRRDFWLQKTRVRGLSYRMALIFGSYVYSFWYSVDLCQTYRQTDRQQTHDDSIYRTNIASRGKNWRR